MNILKKLISTRAGNATLVSLFAFLVYLKTLAPSVTFIDSGELAAVACTLGIAHPTGYPLFTLLGWFFSKLPIASEEIVRLNIMAAAFCAAGVFVFYHLVHFILSGVFATAKSKKEDNSLAIRVASAGAALLLAFSETYWSQATAIEVYSLHVFFLAAVSFAFFKAAYGDEWGNEKGGVTKSSNGWWYIFAFTLGLSFTNHMTTILLAPAFLFLYFATQGFDSSAWKRIGMMAIPFLIGLSVYLYLPLRASQGAVMNWGNPISLERFLWHLSGKQYRVWIFSSTEAAGRQLKYFINELPYEFAYVGLALAILGILFLSRRNWKIGVTVLLLFFGCVFYSINYDIHDIDSYFLLAYFCIALLAGSGLLALYNWFSEKMSQKSQNPTLFTSSSKLFALSSSLLALSLIPCVFHFDRTDETKNYLVEDYTMNMFGSLQPNALVLSYQWDYWVSASFYYQSVKGVRLDVAVVDKELLRRSWYFVQLEKRYPWLIQYSRQEVDAFLKELYKFEHELPYDAAVIQSRFVEMIRSFIAKNISTRPVYVTTEIEQEFTQGYQRVPEGLALRLYDDTLRHASRNISFNYRPFERNGRLEDALKNMYANASNMKGINYIQFGKVDSAAMAFREALSFNSNSADAMNLLRQVER